MLYAHFLGKLSNSTLEECWESTYGKNSKFSKKRGMPYQEKWYHITRRQLFMYLLGFCMSNEQSITWLSFSNIGSRCLFSVPSWKTELLFTGLEERDNVTFQNNVLPYFLFSLVMIIFTSVEKCMHTCFSL